MIQSNRSVAKSDIGTLDLNTRVEMEARITDARVETLDFEYFKNIDMDYERYAAAFQWRRHLFGFLGSMEGKHVLEIACGYSMTPVIFAMAGATVTAIDVAPKSVETVMQLAEYRGVAERITTHVGPAESLPFEDESFDLIYGCAALHHLQLPIAGPEIARVLKKGGKGGFQDPLRHNILLEFARDHVSYENKHEEKGTDLPLLVSDVDGFGQSFDSYSYRGFQLFSMAAKAMRMSHTAPFRRMLDSVDGFIFDQIPFLQRYARLVVTCVTK